MLDYISKKFKLVFAILYTLYAVVSPAGVIAVKAADAPNKGDIYDAATDTYGNSTSVKVSTGSLDEEGNIEITKTVSKTDTLGKYKVSFDIKSKSVTEHTKVPSYTIFVIDSSNSMSSNSAWSNAKTAAINASQTIIDSNEGAKVALISFNTNGTILKGFSHAAFVDSDFGSVGANTNYDAGLMRALELLNNTTFESNAIKNVIFLSDGSPNLGLAPLTGVEDVNTYTSGFGYGRTYTTYSASSIDGYYFVDDGHSYLTGASTSNGTFTGITKDSNGNFTHTTHTYDYDGSYTKNGTLASIKAKLTGEHEHVYSIAYNISNINSSESRNLENIASGSDYYKFTDSSGIGQVLADLANQISQAAAGTNATLTDYLGHQFTVAGGAGQSFTKDIGEIGETNEPIEFEIVIDPNTETGMHDTNAGFELTYTDPDGEEQTLSCNDNPQVYWEGPQYTVNYFIEGETDPFKTEDVTRGVRINDVINENKLLDRIAINTPKGYGYKNLSPESITIGDDKTQNVINVYYDKIPVNIVSNTISKTGTDSISHTDDEVSYVVTYNATIDDFAGSAYIKIVDQLPYAIDTTKTDMNALDGGVYNASNKTITWNITVDDIDTFTSKEAKEITINKSYTVVYNGIDAALSGSSNNTFENNVGATLTLDGSDNETEKAKQVTTIAVIGEVTANYYKDGTTTPLAESETTEGLVGADYTTEEKDIYGYTLKETPSNATGTYAVDPTTVNYYYVQNEGTIEEEATKTADETLANINDSVKYKIEYNATIDDYVGEATVTVVDNLQYKIDEEKSNLAGGIYNDDDKTITWEETFNIDENNKDVEITKNIELYYIGIDSDVIANDITTETTFGKTTTNDDDTAITRVDKGNVIATYTDEAGATLAPSESQTGLVGDEYTTEEKTIYGYTLKETPTNAEGTYTKDDITVEYVYTKNIGNLEESTLEKTATDLDSINDAVTYNISYNAELTDFVGNVRTLIVDTPEFTVDAEKSELDGGTYDPETNTITWIIETDIDENNTIITFNKTLNIYYVDITKDTIENNVTSTLTYDNETDEQEASATSNVAKGSVTATYTDEDGNTLADSELSTGRVGEDYTTEEKTIYGYTLKETPANAEGTYTKEDITVEYVYTKNDGTIDEEANKTSDEVLANINDGVNYTIEYNATIDDYVGDATVTIVDNLQYEIDEEKSELAGGSYNANNKTITWEESFTIDEDNKDISITKTLVLYYKNIDSDTITNTIDTETTFGKTTTNKDDDAETKVDKGTVVATYTDEDGNDLAASESQTGLVGDEYTTEEKTIYGYTLKETPTNAEGTYTKEDIIVEYVYTKNEGTIEEEATKTADETLANINDSVKYKIEYNATIDDYVGPATVTIVDNLQYEIDEEKSELAGGTYNANDKTITWEESFTIDNENNEINITKNIELYYIGIDSDTIANDITTETTFGKTTTNDDDTAITRVDKGNVIATYTDEAGATLAPSESQTGLVGDEYTTEEKTIYGYTLKETPTNAEGTYTKDDITVEYVYTKNIGNLEESTLEKTATDLDSINDAVTYNISYNAELTDFVGNVRTLIVDTPEFTVDAEKSELDGGTYDPETNTITWIIETDIDENNTIITFNKTLNIYYVDITKDTIENNVTSTLTYDNETDEQEASATSNVAKGSVTATYTDEDGNTLADSESSTGLVGDEYTTEEKTIYGYTLKETPANAEGTYTKEDITVEYVYTKNDGTIDEEANKTSDEVLANINDGVNYTIEYNATIDDYVGDATVTIVDNLQYEIDEEKSELAGGTYNANDKTITWEENFTIDEDNKDIEITKTLVLYYKNIDSDTITNTIDTETTFGKTTTNKDDETETKVDKGTVTATYKDEDGKTLADSESSTGLVGEEYTTEEKTIYGYTLKETPTNAEGTYIKEDITVEYVYTKNDGTIEEEANKTSDEVLANINDGVNYTIEYNATIDDYVGEAVTTLVDKLPYKIDTSKSELDGGFYNINNNTITWTESFEVGENNKEISITKNITIYYKDIDSENIANDLETETSFGKTTTNKDDDAITKVKKGTVLVRYVDVDGKEIAPSIKLTGLVGQIYETSEQKIGKYFLSNVIGEKNGYFIDGETEVTYVYDIKNESPHIVPPKTGVTSNLMSLITIRLMMLIPILLAFKYRKEA